MRFILFLALMTGFLMTSNRLLVRSDQGGGLDPDGRHAKVTGGTTNAGVIIDPNG